MSTRSAVIQVEPDLAEAFNAAPKTRQKKALSATRQALRTEKERKAKVPRPSKRERPNCSSGSIVDCPKNNGGGWRN